MKPKFSRIIIAFVITLVAGLNLSSQTPQIISGKAALTGETSLADHIVYYENKGQWPEQVLFRGEFDNGFIFIERDGIKFLLIDPVGAEKIHDWVAYGGNAVAGPADSLHMHCVKLQFENPLVPEVIPAWEESSIRNYFLGNDPSHWAAGVKGYRKVFLNNIYPGIDLNIFSSGGAFKYDFYLHKGADPSRIRYHWEGAETSLSPGRESQLIKTPVGNFSESIPRSDWMGPCGLTAKATVKFVADGNSVSFVADTLPNWTENGLSIDPILIFSTWSGSIRENYGSCSTYGKNGEMYAGGTSKYFGYPTTTGAFSQAFSGGNTDIVITKFSADGTQQIWSTYIGGTTLKEDVYAMRENEDGELIFLGFSQAIDYPVTAGAFDVSHNGAADMVLTHFAANGGSLIGSTYVGGMAADVFTEIDPFQAGERAEIQIDEDGDIYVAAASGSPDFPVTPGAYNTSYVGDFDGVVMKMSGDLTTLVWSTFLPGSVNEFAYGLRLDDNGDIYVCGGTSSPDFSVGSNGPLPFLQGNWDGWLVKLSADGSTLLAGTFIGTNTYDQAQMLDLGRDGSVYVCGQTMSSNFPVSGNPYSNFQGKNFFQKYNPDLTNVLVSTVIGPPKDYPNVAPTAFMVDSCGKIYYAGFAARIRPWFPLLPVTAGAMQDTSDIRNFYYCVFREDFSNLLHGSFYGGLLSQDHAHARTNYFTPKGVLYQVLCTGCRLSIVASPGNPAAPGTGVSTILHLSDYYDLPTTPGAFSENNKSHTCNLAAFKIDMDYWSFTADFSVSPAMEVCQGDSFHFVRSGTGGHVFTWNFGDGTTDSGDSLWHTYDQPGTYQVTLTAFDSLRCISTRIVKKTVKVLILPFVNAGPDKWMCEGGTIDLNGFGTGTYRWEPAAWIANPNDATAWVYPPDTTEFYLTVTGNNGCTDTDTVKVDVAPVDAIFETMPGSPVERDIDLYFIDYSIGPITWDWTFGDGNSSTEQNPMHVYTGDGVYEVMLVISSIGGCQDTAYKEIVVDTRSRLFVPNAFTPNGDGINDLFMPITFLVEDFSMQIFDRNGMLIFSTQDQNEGWNANYLNQPVQEGAYVWHIVAKTEGGKDFNQQGTVTVLR